MDWYMLGKDKNHRSDFTNSGNNSGAYQTTFCSEKCDNISLGLRNLVGKTVQVGSYNNLTWTLLKSTENNPKLRAAFSVIQQCFEPYVNPRTPRDLVEGFMFGKKPKNTCLHFSGFHVMVLERNNEMIAMGTVKIYGGEVAVAEAPVVARWSEHRHEICQLLVAVLEKHMIRLGVTVKLPSIAGVWGSWTNYFRSIPNKEFEGIEKLELPIPKLLDSKGIFRKKKLFYVKKTTRENSTDGKLWMLQLSAEG